MSQKRRGRSLSDFERDLWSRTMNQVQKNTPSNRRHHEPSKVLFDDHSWSDEIETVSISKKAQSDANNQSPSNVNGDVNQSVHRDVRSAAILNQGIPVSNRSDLPRLEVGKNGGTDRRTADRLRRGKLSIDMQLDLHGLTLDIAHRRLLGFLTAAQASGARCVLVITGKGSRSSDGERQGVGRLKAAVPRWLNEPAFRPLVLSVTDARPKDGGTGALYVLLRKSRASER